MTEDGEGARALQAELDRLRRELAAARERIAELEASADVDPLIEMLNRRAFERELARALAYVTRYGTAASLLFIDLDGFKPINDRYGHAAGDAVLKAVAAALSAHVRASDLIGRLGGDEFAVLLWNLDATQAAAKAREVERVIEGTSIDHGGVCLAVGASVGVAPVSEDLGVGALIDAADRAMYTRKRERRG